MPGGDRTGPLGLGPMTGRAAGYCAGYPVPGFMNSASGYFGYGRGIGWGRGRGRGLMYRYFPYRPVMPYATVPPYNPYFYGADEQDIDLLKREAELLKKQLEEVQKHIETLEKEQEK